jgi:hypothetical protein
MSGVAEAEVYTDFEAAFAGGTRYVDGDGDVLTTRVVEVGKLALRSGTVAVGDPFTNLAAISGPNGPIPAGAYPVDVCVITYPNNDCRIAVARLRLADRPATRWVPGSEGAAVDAGTAAFGDGADIDRVLHEATSDALEKALDATYVDTYGTALLDPGGGALSLCAFSSGIGDGVYASWWGLDDAELPVALCLDFDLLTESETDDAEFELPLGRGKLAHPVLARHGAAARVPWLAANRLQVRYQQSKAVHARWKLPDGKYVRPGGKSRFRANGIDYVLDRPPAGARLVLRVSVGMQRMKLLAG